MAEIIHKYFTNPWAAIGSNHHVASVSTSAAASSVISGAAGVTAATGVPSTSLSSSNNAHSGFVDTMSESKREEEKAGGV
ncbi:hypothetical protein CFP56_014116 [Quercus suber]|uniref:Uncharacterized protein n=1 Tax=Quercus suber TaxID=58331 RepID=A0AAW0KRU7_QUESU